MASAAPPTGAWDKEVDVVIVGSGAGGLLAAAITGERDEVLIVEKSGLFGGTSAMSGGGIWIPNSHLAQAAGLEDTPEDAYRYIRALTADNVPDDRIHAFVDQAPKMLRWLCDHTAINYESIAYTDYHAEYPGGKLGYRTHLPNGLDGRLLGDEILAMRRAAPECNLLGIVNWEFHETYSLLFRRPGWIGALLKMGRRYLGDVRQRLRSTQDRFLTLGTALVGGLRLATMRHKVSLWRNTKLIELVRSGDRVSGIVVEREGRRIRIGARKAVILAAGGFERSAGMRAQYLPGPTDPTITCAQENNTGDAIRAAEAIGAATMNMHSSWLTPAYRGVGDTRGRQSAFERALPGSIMVDQNGKRFLNEAASYHIAGGEMVKALPRVDGNQRAWFVFDGTYRRKYPAGPIMPIIPDWLHPKAARQAMKKGISIRDLAGKIGVDPAALALTVRTFNAGAREGRDPQFGRGEAAYDRMYGDPEVTPNPSLAPLETGPFYAIPIYASELGTNGGIVTDAKARVLDAKNKPIGGLYAIGNCTASVMGSSYPGAGATLGPALTFAFIAANDIGAASPTI